MKKNTGILIKVLFIIRICLWITAAAVTVRWMAYSAKLHKEGIFEPAEYAARFRPVFYPCVAIAIGSVAVCFVLYAVGKNIKRKGGISE